MPGIYDNIDRDLLTALQKTLEVSYRADFCVGYFNLRGWRLLAPLVGEWEGGDGKCCRVLVGMHRQPEADLRAAFGTGSADDEIDNQTAIRRKRELAEAFKTQLTIGAPTNADEVGLRLLAAQLRAKKVVVKLFLKHTLHAKLYLLFRKDPINPVVGYLGSSNLTMAGLKHQGELNVDVLEHDACQKLRKWFEERWSDKWCIDISDELAQIIEESWAREVPIPPHHIYVKIAYHLSQEARAGLSEFKIPKEFGNRLFDYQKAAVKIAAHHLNKRGGVILGDVVGLGKTLMATAVARIFEDDYGTETLILCPKNLVPMWEGYREQYRMHARVMSLSVATRELPSLRRYRLVLIDESHNLRNREGKRYSVIRDYIRTNDSRCILLSATPYNKSYLDLANQLRLFMAEDVDLGIRPEQLLSALTESKFLQLHQCGPRTLAAFEKSEYADDWRELMRLFLVRRTRSFIQENYAQPDPANGRKYLTFEDGRRSYFPTRAPKTVKFTIDDADPADQYAKLYSDSVVEAINKLTLPRYGLGNYSAPSPPVPPNEAETRSFRDLSRAGKRLMGFCRTNLFKRLESSGHAFVRSVERHLLRNYVFLHALTNGLPVPIGTQEADLLDARTDAEDGAFGSDTEDDDAGGAPVIAALRTESDFRARAADVYAQYEGRYKSRFRWVRAALFEDTLSKHLKKDNKLLLGVLAACGEWNPARDHKLDALATLLTKTHAKQKVLIFSQFADTVDYLEEQLRARGVPRVAGATGGTADPTALAYRFSPVSNERRTEIPPDQELNVLIATDVLSEGQNLQDCSVVVNYDLPWAIIRLVQRAGRVDRIGQAADRIDCYSFLPADGVERIIRLRSRVVQRLQENAEVVGSDESFFEGEASGGTLLDHLYNEKSGVLDGDADGEVDLASYAYQIWKNAITAEPSLQKTIPDMPPVVFSAKAHATLPDAPPGVLVYAQTPLGNDALVWMDKDGKSVTESQFAILKAAACLPGTPALPRAENHHAVVQKAVEMVATEDKVVGGQLGPPSGARHKVYNRLLRYANEVRGTYLESDTLKKTIEEILRHPLTATAKERLNRQLRAGIDDEDLAKLVESLRDEDNLCVVTEDGGRKDAGIICSLGLIAPAPGG